VGGRLDPAAAGVSAERQPPIGGEPDEAPAAPRPKVTGEDALPGDPSREEQIARMIRVDQAGEYGAVRIYAGQLAVLGRPGANKEAGAAIRAMAATEREHLERFDALIAERGVRPTALQPLWHVAGYALGAATALLGERAAMACTVAVEEVIDRHYAEQANRLGQDEEALHATIEEFRADEIAHKEEALARGAEAAPGYELLTAAVKTGSRLAIWLSTRL
jgi:ubiquinone biosynthesis monooxygenase Coq7